MKIIQKNESSYRSIFRFSLFLPAVLTIVVLAVMNYTSQGEQLSHEKQWEKVHKAMREGLPKTAIEHLEPIIEKTLAEGAHAEAIRAIGQKVALKGNIQGNKPEEKIVLFKAEMADAPEEMQPVMHAILANWYWHYFQHNRWRFMQRTATEEAPGDDITTWDLSRIFAEIDKHYPTALESKKLLRQAPIKEYNALLEKGTMPDSYRPTLYDFTATEALRFYSSGEQAAAKPQDAFVLSAESAIFAPIKDFFQWEIETTDVDAPIYKGILLYQEILAFHRDAENMDALIDHNLDRLRFGYNHAVGEKKKANYKTALNRFIERWSEHEISARAHHDLSSVLKEEGELVKAREIALQGQNQFPDSPGGKLCYNLIQNIERPNVSLSAERVWNDPRQEIEINYKNLTEAHFRLVPWDWEKILKKYPSGHPEQNSSHYGLTEKIVQATPAQEWSAKLPATEDYHMRSDKLLAPDDLTPGFYWLLASHDRDFKGHNNVVSIAPVWVSDLAIIWRTKRGSSELQGLVLDARSGEPVENIRVRTWALAQPWREKKLEEYAPVRTDETGMFRIKDNGGNRRNHVALAGSGDRQLATANQYSLSLQGKERTFTRTVFFTDRAIYRPGQTIHYKGIYISVDHGENNYEVIPNRKLTVTFRDTNNKEIATRQVRTNDYGSFNGTFTAPRDRLKGRMTIQSHNGQTAFNVEEYKRPTFQVTLEPPADATRLNDTVSLTGTAKAYTGAPTDGAQVRWRVARQTQYPGWWYWRRWWQPRSNEKQEIAHGTTKTKVDGTFEIEFTARPEPTAEEEGNPTFRFSIYAEVTDAAGETRTTQRTVNVGFTALKASLSAPDWLVKDEEFHISIHTTSLDGEGRPAEGALAIYSLKQPEKVHRAEIGGQRHRYGQYYGGRVKSEPEPDLSNPDTWPIDKKVAEQEVSTTPGGHASPSFTLPVGAYRAILKTQDKFGKAVRAELPLRIINPEADKLAIRIPHLLDAPRWSVEPGKEFKAVWGSGYDSAMAYVEVEHRGKILQSYWTNPKNTQVVIAQEVTEEMRGGFHIRVTMVHENRAYLESRHVQVPWSNKKLDVAWERFTSKLKPGQEERWTAVISGPNAEKAVAEMVATLYDKSLDAFQPHNWMNSFNVFRRDRTVIWSNFENSMQTLRHLRGSWPYNRKGVQITYRSFPSELISNLWGYGFYRQSKENGQLFSRARIETAMDRQGPPLSLEPTITNGRRNQNFKIRSATDFSFGQAEEQTPEIDLEDVAARKNLNETAFFFPHLVSDENGEVRMEFTMPEALTEWKFLGFAHDRELRAGLLTDSVVTAKELMIQPNPPRFLREGDVLEFTVRVTNQSAARQEGLVRLNFSDARTNNNVDKALGNIATEKKFDVPAKESRTYSWRIEVPDKPGILIYRTVGSTGRLSDGEEGYLPVLSRRIMVTESLPLPIRGPKTKQFTFDKLLHSGQKETLESKTLTLQMVSNPTWYAVMALPYLMEYPHQCSEQIFNRLYANLLAAHIANSDPKIRRVFDQWKGTEALDSPMEKNQDIKAVVLEETPWVRQAESESQARRNVGVLFDQNRLNNETGRAKHQLNQMQLANGAWPWFPEGRPNTYITLYITTGFGRIQHLGVDIDTSPAIRALNYLDDWMHDTYISILQRQNPEKYVPSPMIALYLYSRTFFAEDHPIADKHRKAFNFFIARAKEHWLRVNYRNSQAHLALALHRLGERDSARAIMRSIKERSVTDEELGMYWRELELSWWWFRAPIETQAMMIEAFDEVMNDSEAVEECRVWLLKQKQTQDWKTTRATADAVYALLLRGYDRLASDELVEVSLGDTKIEPEDIEAGTGFYEKRFVGPEIKPEMGNITLKKIDKGVAWGGLHWQYLEDISNITPHEGTPLTLKKALYTKEHSKSGPVLEEVDGPVEVGDELVARIVLRTDRDMEYVHLKDYRGSGTEPVNVLSRYRYQDGLRYYESTGDTASHFFIDYLPKGTYVFEYSVRVQHRGTYQSGIAQIQCMYAPEFNSHSESIKLEVK